MDIEKSICLIATILNTQYTGTTECSTDFDEAWCNYTCRHYFKCKHEFKMRKLIDELNKEVNL